MAKQTAVVVLNWNSKEMTAECLRSLLVMDARDFEIVVVDNGSKDGSPDFLRKAFPQIAVVESGRNLGFAAGCNVGMKRALADGAEYVLLINNDTLVDPRFLDALLQEAERRPDAGLVSPKIYFYELPEQIWWAGGTFSLWAGIPGHMGRNQRDCGQWDLPRPIDWATGCALLVRCKALREVGLFDEVLFGNGEDLDLSLRMHKSGYAIRYAPGARVWHKEGVDYRKNAGEHTRKFTGTRNILWIMHNHASFAQWLTFWPNFLVRYVLVFVLLSVWRGDWRSAGAVLKGAFGYVPFRLKPSIHSLPPELGAARQAAARE